MIPAFVVKQGLAHAPAGSFPHHFHGVAETFDLGSDAEFVVKTAQGDLCPVADLGGSVRGTG